MAGNSHCSSGSHGWQSLKGLLRELESSELDCHRENRWRVVISGNRLTVWVRYYLFAFMGGSGLSLYRFYMSPPVEVIWEEKKTPKSKQHFNRMESRIIFIIKNLIFFNLILYIILYHIFLNVKSITK